MQNNKIPDSLRRLMAKVGPIWRNDTRGHIALMVREFTEILTDSPKDGVTVTRDIHYGSHERQLLDVFGPTNVSDKKPVLIFVHGGGFTDGHRNKTNEIYANVCYFFARHGIVSINMGYRLAPDAQFPAGTEDVASAVQWVRMNAGRFRIDSSKIFLMGHSAGAAHISSYAYDRRHQPISGHGLAGLLIISGRVRADNRPDNPNAKRVEAYYGEDSSLYDYMSPVSHVDASSLPTFIAFAEFENPLIDVYCTELAYRLAAAKRRAPPLLWLKDHNHTSMIGQLNLSDDELGPACVTFIDSVRESP